MFSMLIKTASRLLTQVDYKPKSQLDQNTKKLDKVRQPDESIKNPFIKLDNLVSAENHQ